MEQNRPEESVGQRGVGSSLPMQESSLEESVKKEENRKVEIRKVEITGKKQSVCYQYSEHKCNICMVFSSIQTELSNSEFYHDI